MVKILLERGANVNEIDYKDMTPLKLAIRSGVFYKPEKLADHLDIFAFP